MITARTYGIREFNRSLRQAAGVAGKDLSAPGRDLAQRIVIPAAQRRAGQLGRMQVRSAATLRPASVQGGGAVRLGYARVPFALGAEFGAARNTYQTKSSRRLRRVPPGWQRTWARYRGLNQFQPWRGDTTEAGYFLWPAIRATLPQLQREYLEALTVLARRHGLTIKE